VAAPLRLSNVDTDQIIPARFLQKPRKDGYADFLFRDLRFDESGAPRHNFILKPAAICIRAHSGCGPQFRAADRRGKEQFMRFGISGFRSVIAPSFGDIFFNNSLKNGFLPIVLAQSDVDELLTVLSATPGARLNVDLNDQSVKDPDGTIRTLRNRSIHQTVSARGVDELEYTLSLSSEIAAFETRIVSATE